LLDFMNTMTAYYVLYDLMMIVDRNGRPIAVNTKDKDGNKINSLPVLNENFLHENWFKVCVSDKGPAGGAWYSDFMLNPLVGAIYQSEGKGMAFAAPIRNKAGQVVGVWYNYASWQEITRTIRHEVETEIQKDDQYAAVVLTRNDGVVIDAADPNLASGSLKITERATASDDPAAMDSEKAYSDYVSGWATAKGAYTYKGNNWKAVTLLSRSHVNLARLFSSEMLPVLLAVVVVLAVLGWVAVRFFRTHITSRIHRIRDLIEQLAEGRMVTVADDLRGNDEIGRIAVSLAHLTRSTEGKVAFSNEIAVGNLAADLAAVPDSDVLGRSLLHMRDQLRQTAEADRRRNWHSDGLARAAEIFRQTTELQPLTEQTLVFLVRYLNANQGAVFVQTEENGETVLTMAACYAFNRKKHLEKTIRPGEGIAGQVYLEGEYVYLTKIPDQHLTITSGLGESTPACLLVLPLLHDQRVEGVLELASFNTLEPFEIEFVAKCCESLAAALHTAKINQKTLKLLEQSQQQAEALQAQEEEMRQNMEEMASIQETMARKEAESEVLVEAVNQSLAAIRFDTQGNILTANDIFLQTMGYRLDEIQGRHHRMFVEPAEAESAEYKSFWQRLHDDKPFVADVRRIAKGGREVWIHAAYTPVKDGNGRVIGVIKLARDITAEREIRTQVAQQAEKLQAQEELLRQKLQEMAALQEQTQRQPD
nr:PAS domain S-box protein [Cytophagales bacterium]